MYYLLYPTVTLWIRFYHFPILQMKSLRFRKVGNLLHRTVQPVIGGVQSHLASLLCYLPRHRMELRT